MSRVPYLLYVRRPGHSLFYLDCELKPGKTTVSKQLIIRPAYLQYDIYNYKTLQTSSKCKVSFYTRWKYRKMTWAPSKGYTVIIWGRTSSAVVAGAEIISFFEHKCSEQNYYSEFKHTRKHRKHFNTMWAQFTAKKEWYWLNLVCFCDNSHIDNSSWSTTYYQ